MGINSKDLSEDGYALCVSCRKKKFIEDLADQCVMCGRWVCKSCATYRRQGYPYGYMCKSCKNKK